MSDKPWSPEQVVVEKKRREHVEDALVAYGGNITQAAEALGIARSYMNKLIREFGLVDRAKELRGGRGAGRPPGG